MDSLSRIGLLFWMGARNVALHRVKSLVVGLILFLGTFLLVTGGALTSSLRASMEKSITSSISGQIQLYDSNARDDLSLFPAGNMGTMDIGEIADFRQLHDLVMDVPNVKDVVPMGIANAIVLGDTAIDRIISQLRKAVSSGDTASIAHLRKEVVQIAADLELQVINAKALSADPPQQDEQLADLVRLQEDAFWADLDTDPELVLTFLDSRIAPLASDGRSLYLRLIGTNLDQFSQAFESMRVVKGGPVPAGRRGMLLSDRFYESQVKNIVAHGLDQVEKALADGKTIADSPALRDDIKQNARQYQRVLYLISPEDAPLVEKGLRDAIPGATGDLATLLQSFLMVDDTNFAARYALFYSLIAPRIRLYEVGIGETVTLRSFTKSGYARAVNVRLHGTVSFDGLGTSDLAGANQLVDLVTFRSLYGKMSAEQQAELADIRSSTGVREVSRASAEADLFGGGSPLEKEAAPPAVKVPVPVPVTSLAPDGLEDRVYTEAEIEDGLVLNAAVILEEPRRSRSTLAAIRKALDDRNLQVQAVDWRKAAGLVGQLITVIQALLVTGIGVIFIVAMAIINNTMMMSAMERTQEVGTMRAIGAPRSFVVWLFLVESVILGIVAGALGCAAALGVLGILGHVGIPAVADILVLIFAGPRLYPTFSVGWMLGGLALVVVFAVLSATQPTLLAARTSPAIAMSPKE